MVCGREFLVTYEVLSAYGGGAYPDGAYGDCSYGDMSTWYTETVDIDARLVFFV